MTPKNLINLASLIFFSLFLSSSHIYQLSHKQICEQRTESENQKDTSCLDFHGEGLTCGYELVCPGEILYSSTRLLNYINNNLALGAKKVPATCCRRYDTLSLAKEIYLMEVCWGGSYTETWVYQKNSAQKFTSQKYYKKFGSMSLKLDSKTNGVNNFLLYNRYSDPYTYFVMTFREERFDTCHIVLRYAPLIEDNERELDCSSE